MAQCTCVNCGSVFEARRRDARYCGPQCRPPCSIEGCGKPSFCRSWCRQHHKRWVISGSTDLRQPDPCETCGSPVPLPRSGRMPKYCGEACRPRRADTCALCCVQIDNALTVRKFCSVSCRDRYHRNPGVTFQRDCVLCGTAIDFNAIGPGGRKLKSDTYTCRDCRRHGRPELTTQQLAERDGLNCSLCSDPVDMSLEWPHPMSPTVDHIVPWSLGGTHDAENLALAHLTCNRSKSNKAA